MAVLSYMKFRKPKTMTLKLQPLYNFTGKYFPKKAILVEIFVRLLLFSATLAENICASKTIISIYSGINSPKMTL